MQFINTFQLHDFLDTLISLFVAFALGTLIGAERQYRQRSAGLRTNVVVSVGAAAFIDLAYHLTGLDGAVRVIAQVVSGIGFSGAGAIMKGGHQYSLASTPAVERAAEMRDVLNERLQAANYPIRETKVVYRSDDNVEVAAKLVALAAEPDELDAVVAGLAKLSGGSHVTRNVSALE